MTTTNTDTYGESKNWFTENIEKYNKDFYLNDDDDKLNSNRNKQRWLKIEFPVPKVGSDGSDDEPQTCGDVDFGCEPDTDNLVSANYFIIWKLEPSDPKHLQIRNHINDKSLSFDDWGNVGWQTKCSRGIGEPIPTDDSGEDYGGVIMYNNTLNPYHVESWSGGYVTSDLQDVSVTINGNKKDTLWKPKNDGSYIPYPYCDHVLKVSSSKTGVNKNGKFIMNSALTYILYNDVDIPDSSDWDNSQLKNGNFYLLYNPIQRKSFYEQYFGNQDLLKYQNKKEPLYILTKYCYSTANIVTDNNDDDMEKGDYYFGDKTCNCFCPPITNTNWYTLNPNYSPTLLMGVHPASSTSTTTPLTLSTIYNKNKAFWQESDNLPASVNQEFTIPLQDEDVPDVKLTAGCLNNFCTEQNNNNIWWKTNENSFVAIEDSSGNPLEYGWKYINVGECTDNQVKTFCDNVLYADNTDNYILENTNFVTQCTNLTGTDYSSGPEPVSSGPEPVSSGPAPISPISDPVSVSSDSDSKESHWWSFLDPIINLFFPKDNFSTDNIYKNFGLLVIIITLIIMLIILIKKKIN